MAVTEIEMGVVQWIERAILYVVICTLVGTATLMYLSRGMENAELPIALIAATFGVTLGICVTFGEYLTANGRGV